MIATLALALSALVTPTSAPAPPLAPCVGAYVIVHGDDPTGCDLRPGQRLDVLDVTRAECDDMGGAYDAPGQCAGVDY